MTIPFVPILSCSHRDKLGQVLIECPQTIVNPRPQIGEFAIKHMPSRMKLGLGTMIVISSPHGFDDGHFVYHGTKVRIPIGNGNTALTPFLKPDLPS